MKRLMIAAAIAFAAVVSQGAILGWSTWGYINDGSEESDWITGGQAYLVLVSDSANFAVANDLTVTGGSIVDNMAFVDGTAAGSWNVSDELTDGQNYKFAMILTSAGTGAELPTTGTYGVDSFYDVTWNSATGIDFVPEHDGIAMNTAVAGSSPIPEPTSGLLMLLGMAGLALRRRRA